MIASSGFLFHAWKLVFWWFNWPRFLVRSSIWGFSYSMMLFFNLLWISLIWILVVLMIGLKWIIRRLRNLMPKWSISVLLLLRGLTRYLWALLFILVRAHDVMGIKRLGTSLAAQQIGSRCSVFQWISKPRQSVFERLNVQNPPSSKAPFEFSNFAGNGGFWAEKGTGSSNGHGAAYSREKNGPTEWQSKQAPKTVDLCKRCLSSNHSWICYRNQIKCWNCKGWGHTLSNCSLVHSNQGVKWHRGFNHGNFFSSSINISLWEIGSCGGWFKVTSIPPIGPA